MNLFSEMTDMGHEQVVFCRNDDVGLRAIIAIHDTTLGPALGGLRLFNYGNEQDALRDVRKQVPCCGLMLKSRTDQRTWKASKGNWNE